MSELITGLLVLGGFLLFVAWFTHSIMSMRRFEKRRQGFKAGTFAAAEGKIVNDLLGNIQNYNLPRPFSDTLKFTCGTCCSTKLSFEYHKVRIINRLKPEAMKQIYNIINELDLIYDHEGYEIVTHFQYFANPDINMEFQYLEADCGGCKRYIADFAPSGGKCGEAPIQQAPGDDVA